MKRFMKGVYRNGSTVACAIALLLISTTLIAGEERSLHPELEKFRPFIGHTYVGEFADSTPEKPVIDVSKWERALNGNAVRILHSLNKGEYGGETLIFYDKEKETLVYYYFTTAGFFTTATVQFDGENFVSHEEVSGNENGVTDVKSTATLDENGNMTVQSDYFKADERVGGHSVIYHRNDAAEVVLK